MQREEARLRARYRIAGLGIEIASCCPEVHRLCRDYRAEGRPELTIETTPADIARERQASGGGFSDGYLETLAVYRKIAEAMPAFDTLLFHASALEADGEGVLFAAPSGTGKSTHAALWLSMLGSRARMINDDKPLLRISEEEIRIFGTPWRGKHCLGENISAPLAAVFFLERAAENSARRIGRREALLPLLRQAYRPADPSMMKRTMALLDALAGRAALYSLRCNMLPEAAEVAYKAMKG